jgi:hypothetical protein
MIKTLIEKLKALRIYAVMRSADDIQELYCGNCDKDTKQKVHESGHERDSSNDRFECTECGFVKHGLTGEWEHYA